jgi:hypothetical protein
MDPATREACVDTLSEHELRALVQDLDDTRIAVEEATGHKVVLKAAG